MRANMPCVGEDSDVEEKEERRGEGRGEGRIFGSRSNSNNK